VTPQEESGTEAKEGCWKVAAIEQEWTGDSRTGLERLRGARSVRALSALQNRLK
jgi:hypothetical protein